MKIKKLQIDNFRHIKNVEIVFGNKLTIISGQNGTGKSSILGWVAQLCDFKKKNKRLNEESFKEDFKYVFKFCPTNDFDKNYKVIFTYKDETDLLDSTKTITTRFQQKTDKSTERYRTDFDGRGNALDFPIIYLGLKRLIPLATERKISVKTTIVPQKYITSFSKLAKEILILIDNKIKPESIKSSNKDLLAMKTENYGHLGNSAGQDNIGQIVTAIISFKRLKTHLGENYNGGILLIDELDASMFPAAQEKLIEFLFKVSAKLNLQCVFTTHSIEILEILLTSKYKHQSKVCYFHKANGPIEKAEESNLKEIVADLKAQVLIDKVKDTKIEVYLEDKEAEQLLKSILTPAIKKKIKIIPENFGAELLLTLANKKIPAFKRSVIVLDGDKKPSVIKPNPRNVITLPGEDSPEKIMFNFLSGLEQNHPFWGNLGGYTKQVCFRDLKEIGNRDVMKNWWKNQIKHWGVNGRKLFSYWKSENAISIEKFNKEFEKKIKTAYNNVYN